MSTKKTKTKKPVAKKATAKKATPKTKAQAKPKAGVKAPNVKPQPSKQAALKSLAILPTIKPKGKDARRPTPNPPLDNDTINVIASAFNAIRDILTESAANIRPLDRARLNGVGIKKQGFIERAFAAAVENEQFLPQYLTIDKFRGDFQYFVNLRSLFEACTQLREFIWNLTIQSADITYTDALEFYASVREASKRRIDGAETIHRDLEIFFRRTHTTTEVETEKKTKRDFNALLHGKRDGKIVIENIKPKTTAGVHKIIDEKFTDTEQFKETEEGEIKE